MNAVTDTELDAFRARTDDALDDLVSALSPRAVGEMLGALFRGEGIPVDDDRFRVLCDRLRPVPVDDPRLVEAGQQLFQLYGPEILLVLGCYALPAAYAASDGVQLIYRARRLKDDGQRRLSETAQMLINVMVPGGLEPGGIGARSARKVRLMHALVRQHVRTLKDPAWSATLGAPLNQEDLGGTLLTFTLVVLDGLRKIGAPVSPNAERGYFAAWAHIATILGIEPRLIPRDAVSARALAASIARRQFRPSVEGRHLARELMKVNDALFPIPGYGLSLMHFFLDGSVFGVNLAELLDLPAPNWTRLLVRTRAAQKRAVLRWLEHVPGASGRRRALARFFTQRLILMQRPDKQSPFEVPPSLWESWRLGRRKRPVAAGRAGPGAKHRSPRAVEPGSV